MWRTAVFLTSLLFGCVTYAEQSLVLTPQEQQWIHKHPVVRYTSAANYVSDNRTYLIDQITLMSGLRFEKIRTKSWTETKTLITQGHIDLITAINNSVLDHSSRQGLILSNNYYMSSTVMVTRAGEIKSFPLKINGKAIAIIEGDRLNAFLQRDFKKATLIIYSTPTLALKALAEGDVDAVIGMTSQLHPIMRDEFYNIFEWTGIFPGVPDWYVMGISPAAPELVSIINKSIAAFNASFSGAALESLLMESETIAPSWKKIQNHYTLEIAVIIFAMIAMGIMASYARRAQKIAQRSTSEKSAFLAMMSHEIRSPMNAVMSSIELLQTTSLTAHQQELTVLASSSACNLLELLNDVLDVSKLEAGMVQLERTPTDVELLVQSLAGIHRLAALSHNTSLTLDVAGLANVLLMVDSIRIRQVITNLLSNAVKFTQYGDIELSIHFEITGPNIGRLKVRVSDTGIGIDQIQQARLFQAFVQADNSITRRYGGSGLGLSICKQLVELMGGQIYLNSALGRGTRVSFTLSVEFQHRVTDTLSSTPSQPEAAVPALTWQQVLVVEDDPINQRAIGLQLDELGYRALIVDDGIAALEMMESQRDTIAIVLLDCHLPDMDGYEVAQHIRKQEKLLDLPHMPIIAISASINEEHQRRCIESGIDGNLSKPLSLSGLRQLFELWLSTPPTQTLTTQTTAEINALGCLFIKIGSEDIIRLRNALESGDRVRALHYVHRLHGSALTAKSYELAKLAKELEDSLRELEGLNNDWIHQLDTVEKALDRFSEKLQ
ncbi:hypothetical protein C4K35_4135 [Pseudomonas chlororaphis subsp. piscium]|uniref:ATP-binding protein n=1 Tax=Pseudomonas chlororaphis TaxID=587753 RepID=UPI000F58C039|nr:ATP-binding protein [Pseudomonas chlororaphis]AZC51714.1 hypothetical protein C4K35_4135 [Pseudomonas chlororaphis subsp. piscium]